jgi:hypothetical protein
LLLALVELELQQVVLVLSVALVVLQPLPLQLLSLQVVLVVKTMALAAELAALIAELAYQAELVALVDGRRNHPGLVVVVPLVILAMAAMVPTQGHLVLTLSMGATVLVVEVAEVVLALTFLIVAIHAVVMLVTQQAELEAAARVCMDKGLMALAELRQEDFHIKDKAPQLVALVALVVIGTRQLETHLMVAVEAQAVAVLVVLVKQTPLAA